MSTPPSHPGPVATESRPAPPGAGSGPPQARPVKFSTHQVLWGLGGLIAGLATGIVGTAAESTAPARADPMPVSSPTASATQPASTAAHQDLTGTTMTGDGLFRIGPDLKGGYIRAGTWLTAGAIGGATGSCYVALLHRAGTWSVIASQIVTGPDTITTTGSTRAIRTSGCRPWHRVSAGIPAGDGGSAGSRAGAGISTQNDGITP
jgi:hypothetical protein